MNEEYETEEFEEEKDVDVLEFGLDKDEIEDLISKLIQLKEDKKSFSFEVDDENELTINYEENGEGDNGENNDENGE